MKLHRAPYRAARPVARSLATVTTTAARASKYKAPARLAQCSLWQCARSSDGRLVVATSLLGFVPSKPTRGRADAHAQQWDKGFTHVSVLARAALAEVIVTSTEARLTDVDGARTIAERVAAEVAPALVPYGTRLVQVEARAQPLAPVDPARSRRVSHDETAESVRTEITADFRAAYDLQQLRQTAMALAGMLDVDPFGDAAVRLIMPYLLAAEHVASVRPSACAYTPDQVNDALMGYLARVSHDRHRRRRPHRDDDSSERH